MQAILDYIKTTEDNLDEILQKIQKEQSDSKKAQPLVFLALARQGETEKIKELLENGFDLRLGEDIPVGEEAILWAAEKGHTETVKLLAQHGVNVQSYLNAPLRSAIDLGHAETVQALLDLGANPDCKKDILFVPAREGHTKVVEILLDHGADIHVYQDSLLYWAAVNGRIETIKLMLQRGADIPGNREKALTGSVAYGHIETTKFLLSGIQPRENGPTQKELYQKLLEHAAEKGQSGTIELLLDLGADMHANEEAAIKNAIKGESTQCIKFLLIKGNYEETNPAIALTALAALGKTERVKALLAKGTKVREFEVETPSFVRAAKDGLTELAKLLLKAHKTRELKSFSTAPNYPWDLVQSELRSRTNEKQAFSQKSKEEEIQI